MAGDTIASRCVLVILDINKPFVVEFISSSEDAFGVIVPMPALPVAGNVFVCACVYRAIAVNVAVASRFFFTVLLLGYYFFLRKISGSVVVMI